MKRHFLRMFIAVATGIIIGRATLPLPAGAGYGR